MPTPTDDRPKMNVTLADLGILADTAGRNGTRDAFVEVALQWAGEANAAIERLQAENQALRADAERWQTHCRLIRQKHGSGMLAHMAHVVDTAIAKDHP